MLQGIIISDTHYSKISFLGEKLTKQIIEADFIIHAGDFDTSEFISELKKISKELYAVRGNSDEGTDFPRKSVFEIEGLKIGLCHKPKESFDIEAKLFNLFYEDNPNIIIFGHTHMPMIKKINGLTFINPGSVSKNRGLAYETYCRIFIDGENFKAEIIPMDYMI